MVTCAEHGYLSADMIMLAFRPRTLTRFFAVAQLALPAVLGVADAMTAVDGRGAPNHVEEAASSHCRSAHVDDCMICRHLSTNATKAEAAPSFVAQAPLVPPAATVDLSAQLISRRGLHSRAPPELLV